MVGPPPAEVGAPLRFIDNTKVYKKVNMLIFVLVVCFLALCGALICNGIVYSDIKNNSVHDSTKTVNIVTLIIEGVVTFLILIFIVLLFMGYFDHAEKADVLSREVKDTVNASRLPGMMRNTVSGMVTNPSFQTEKQIDYSGGLRMNTGQALSDEEQSARSYYGQGRFPGHTVANPVYQDDYGYGDHGYHGTL